MNPSVVLALLAFVGICCFGTGFLVAFRLRLDWESE